MREYSGKKVGIIGAGPAGLTAAYELAKAGIAVDVFEAGPNVGGLAQSFELWNQTVDLGPHRFFSSDSRINKVWFEVAGEDYRMVNRLTRIYYNSKLFYYPLKPFDALRKLGIFQSIHSLSSYLAEKIRPTPDTGTFESWVVRRFGYKLYSTFFKTYSEKLWGIPCTDLDEDFAAQRIKKLSLWEAVKNAFKGGKGNTHKTLIDQFAYPIGGNGMIYNRMADFVSRHGGRIHLKSPVFSVVTGTNDQYGLTQEDGTTLFFDHVISTMPLTLLVNRLPNVPVLVKNRVNSLTFRNTILVYLKVESDRLFPDNWLYVHSKELLTGRITNFRNWVPEINRNEKASILTLEYWCYNEDEIWQKTDDELIQIASEELKKTGLVGSAAISAGFVKRLARSYPVYSKGYKDVLKPVQDYLSSLKGLSVIGRYGSFKYNNQDHSILMGILAAENISSDMNHDLWEINTDYESYQESASIENLQSEVA
ncbi:FAD-dependent oxidoreductase [Larkinella rosea]|uniref:FAD-dependent oxidoreductase n=1 Tax=Larkinella rosea TaxID=2025312 RepID=A0A3P1BS91_9BACT|nr:FAD-dependent oxidoreductase [Larkinella rosea]RRB03962.1 FAD-dependent oxidoreductase [Larkinella rosea]